MVVVPPGGWWHLTFAYTESTHISFNYIDEHGVEAAFRCATTIIYIYMRFQSFGQSRSKIGSVFDDTTLAFDCPIIIDLSFVMDGRIIHYCII